MITVNSWEELLTKGENFILNQIANPEINLQGDLLLTVRVRGTSWNEYIDYRGANYIIELQKTVNRLYHELSGSDIPLHGLNEIITVKVKVVEGSQQYKIDLTEAFKAMLNKISGPHAALLAGLLLLSVTGSYNYSSYLEHTEKTQAMGTSTQILEQITPVYKQALDLAEKVNTGKASRVLINKMGPEDLITFPGKEEISVTEAKNLYPRKPPLTKESGYFEDHYRILSIDFEKTPPVIRLYKSGFNINAVAQLAGDDVEKLASGLEQAMGSGQDFNIFLKLFILYNKRGIKDAAITSIGNPSVDAENMNDLIAKFD